MSENVEKYFREHRNDPVFFDWIQKHITGITYAYQGVSHTVNTIRADLETNGNHLLERIQELENRVETLEAEKVEANAAIGELQEGFARMREWAKRVDSKGE